MLTVINIEPTPNPNAMKFVVNSDFVPTGSITYAGVNEVGADPLALGLFRIPGVESVFYMQDFVTITKEPSASWDSIIEEAESLISSTPPVINVTLPAPSAAARPGGAVGPGESPDGMAFEKMSDDQRISRINHILDEEIRPALAGDGGGLQVLGLDGYTLKVHYQGACGSCPTSSAGTLKYIESRLQELLSGKLVLESV